jgi:citrate lyase subunit beta/citryl-CoA lyase
MNPSIPLDHPLAQARSLLFVPGNRPERFAKALASGADAVVLDLEDAVPLADKPAARAAIAGAWAELSKADLPLVVRINALESDAGRDDLQWLRAGAAASAALMVPKAESGATLDRLAGLLPGRVLLPLIESAAGHAALAEIAAAPGVLRLAVGHIDFVADTGLQPSADEAELAPLRFAVAMATRLHALAPAIDGVTVDIADEDRLREDTCRALRFGFGAKLCIHPRQVAGVHAALAPGSDQIAWARRVIAADAAAGGAAVQLDGRMVDAPVVLQARRVLARLREPDAG